MIKEEQLDNNELSLEELQQEANEVKEKLDISKNVLIQKMMKKEKLKQMLKGLKESSNIKQEMQM